MRVDPHETAQRNLAAKPHDHQSARSLRPGVRGIMTAAVAGVGVACPPAAAVLGGKAAIALATVGLAGTLSHATNVARRW